jgi:hypothetical protein
VSTHRKIILVEPWKSGFSSEKKEQPPIDSYFNKDFR